MDTLRPWPFFLLSFAVGDGIFFSFLVFFFVLVDGGDGFISNE